MRKIVAKGVTLVKDIPNRKGHIDVLLAVLTVPVLITAIITNISTLQNKDKPQQAANAAPQEKTIVISPSSKETLTPRVTPNDQISSQPTNPSCKKEVGPLSISYPHEGETVTNNPVCIFIDYDDSNYCSVVWSYRINNGSWSDYNSNSVCLYDKQSGPMTFELRAKSTVSNDEDHFERKFNYQNPSQSTESATTQ